MNDVLRWLDSNYPSGMARPTLAALPEGDMLNYLARLRNPTPYSTFMPPEVMLLGQSNMIDAFRKSPPDLILLVHRNASDYDVPWFGRDYAVELWSWIQENYRTVKRFGDPPMEPGSRFGVDVLERRPSQELPNSR